MSLKNCQIDWMEIVKNALMWVFAISLCTLIWWFGGKYTRKYAEEHFTNKDEYEHVGLFGDSFGAVNALISAFAFAGVIVTFSLQRKELDLQRQELKAQRNEFAQQNKTLKLQRFENTFFHMMELQQQIVSDLSIQLQERELVANTWVGGKAMKEVYVEGLVKGRQVFAYIYWHRKTTNPKGVYIMVHEKGIEGYPESPYIEILDHYFRHLYTILRFVDETDAFATNDEGNTDEEYEFKQKYHYTTILRATLSRYELLMLYYNGLSKFGHDRLKPLIEKYALLNNIDKESLSISKEYEAILINFRSEGWHIQYGITGKDYEYFLTEEKDNPQKYNVRAFGIHDKEIESAKKAIEKFNIMKEEYAKKFKYGGTIIL